MASRGRSRYPIRVQKNQAATSPSRDSGRGDDDGDDKSGAFYSDDSFAYSVLLACGAQGEQCGPRRLKYFVFLGDCLLGGRGGGGGSSELSLSLGSRGFLGSELSFCLSLSLSLSKKGHSKNDDDQTDRRRRLGREERGRARCARVSISRPAEKRETKSNNGDGGSACDGTKENQPCRTDAGVGVGVGGSVFSLAGKEARFLSTPELRGRKERDKKGGEQGELGGKGGRIKRRDHQESRRAKRQQREKNARAPGGALIKGSGQGRGGGGGGGG
jgi:hypothetical protein